ncbi:MAG: peptidase, partial [Amylibacter sp.]|nr:peptidase [Amylibacter sp.]MDT2058670.1 imelysin family protein [Planktomarina sp.]
MELNCKIATMMVIAIASPAAALDEIKVLDTYANIAEAKFEDSLITAQRLKAAVTKLVNTPSADNLTQARKAWFAARVPYQQTEVYRFGNSIV